MCGRVFRFQVEEYVHDIGYQVEEKSRNNSHEHGLHEDIKLLT